MIPKVSVIIPCYGVEKYLDRCINTIVNQTLKDIEIILVDDGSPDRVPAMCDEWASKDSRIKVIHKKNEGLGYARNSGLKIAKGEYVAFVDSDDYVDVRMYETLYSATEYGLYDAVYGGLRQETKEGGFKYFHDYSQIRTFHSNEMPRLALSFVDKTELNENERLFMSVWHSIYKMKVIRDNGILFFSERQILSEDMPFQIQFLQHSTNIKFIPDYLYTYCLNESSLTHNIRYEKIEAAIRLRELLIGLLNNESDGQNYVDKEFYIRVRNLISRMVRGKVYPYLELIRILRRMSCNNVWKQINYDYVNTNSLKFIIPLKLIKCKLPVILYWFMKFDAIVNRQTIKF